ncbi:hypothetical protein D3C80_1000810 [compost metagenome]
MAEKADARTRPMITESTEVQNRSTWGSSRVKGATPRMEIQITRLRPMRSPTGPPSTVPAATANRNANRWNWALSRDRLNLSIR